MKTIVIGLGNPILGDDGVGWQVVEEMEKRSLPSSAIAYECLSLGGIGLMERLIGYDRAILIDAFVSNEEEVGTILIRHLSDLPDYSAFHTTSAHDTSLQNALQLGQMMGAHLPEDVIVIGIAIRRIREFGDKLSPPVAEVVTEAAHIALNLLQNKVIV